MSEPLFPDDPSADEALPPALVAYIEKLYMEAWTAYLEAGFPFGLSAQAMTLWFVFDQKTRAN